LIADVAVMTEARTLSGATQRSFFVVFAALSVVVVLIGFARTFFMPVAHGTFRAPPIVYVHASLFLAWISLLVAQTVLAFSHNLRWHRQLGWITVVLIPVMIASDIGVSLWATARDLRGGQGDVALAFLFGLFMDVASFAALATVAVVMRRKPQVHKRLIVIATIRILGPAIGRIPRIGAMSAAVLVALLLSVIAYDLVTRGRVHAATLWGGSALFATVFTQAPLGATSLWLSVARRIMMLAPY
jgi:hypothetical protein